MRKIVPYRVCSSCGIEITELRWRRGSRTCPDCAMARVIINVVELRAQMGAGYANWLAGMARYVSRETSRQPDAASDPAAESGTDLPS